MSTATDEIYTLAEIKSGNGFFTNGDWTLIYRIGDDEYMTCAKSEEPMNPDAELVGGGQRGENGRPRIRWC
jgi:hypothetical protein